MKRINTQIGMQAALGKVLLNQFLDEEKIIMDTKIQLQKKLAVLESAHDHLISELADIDQLMHLIGFNNGIEGLKETALELRQEVENLPTDELSF